MPESKTIVSVLMFCQRNAAEASKPGVSTRHLQLNSVRKEHDGKDPNAALFDDPTGGAIGVQMNGVSAAVAAAIPNGKTIKVTFEVLD